MAQNLLRSCWEFQRRQSDNPRGFPSPDNQRKPFVPFTSQLPFHIIVFGYLLRSPLYIEYSSLLHLCSRSNKQTNNRVTFVLRKFLRIAKTRYVPWVFREKELVLFGIDFRLNAIIRGRLLLEVTSVLSPSCPNLSVKRQEMRLIFKSEEIFLH